MHFMSALWNAQTRPEAWMQLKNGIGATGLALSTKYKELSELTPKGLGEALGAGASDAASYLVPESGIGKGTARTAGVFANNAADALRLKTILALQSAGILDQSGRLTDLAIKKSDFAMSTQGILKNPSVIRELTKDGSKITDWVKMKTDSFRMPTGQSMQVHFYKNKITGEINYTHPDFKVKGQVNAFSDSSNFEISIKNITM